MSTMLGGSDVYNLGVNMYSYTQLVQMVLRLIAAGMPATRAVDQVARGYAVDANSLTEWVRNHNRGE